MRCCSRHDVAGDAPQNMGFVRREPRQFGDEVARNRSKSIPVIKTKGRQPMALQTNFERFSKVKIFRLILSPQSFSRRMSIGSWFVKCGFLFAKAAIDLGNEVPVEGGKPGPNEARHESEDLVRRRFSQAGLDSLQRRHAFALQMTLPRSGQNRFSGETVLNPESIFHDPLQPLLLRFCHVRTILNLNPNRKPKHF